MKTVARIIAAFGGLERLRQPGNYIRLENPPYIQLVVEYIGQGPRGLRPSRWLTLRAEMVTPCATRRWSSRATRTGKPLCGNLRERILL